MSMFSIICIGLDRLFFDKTNGWHGVIRLLALVYYTMAASTGVEVANFNLAYLCEGNHVSLTTPAKAVIRSVQE